MPKLFWAAVMLLLITLADGSCNPVPNPIALAVDATAAVIPDGSECKPFASIMDAINAIQANSAFNPGGGIAVVTPSVATQYIITAVTITKVIGI
jgi:hypothetical protein